MTDAHSWRDCGEVAEGGLAPLEEGVALAVALEFERGVEGVGVAGAVFVDLNGVIDDELGGLEGVDLLRIAAEDLHRIAHGREVDDGRDAGEVLHEDAGGHPGNFARGLGFGVPFREELDIVGGDGFAVLIAEKIFEQDAEAEGQAMEIDAAFFERAEAEDFISLAAGFQFGLAAVGIHDVSFRGERRRSLLTRGLQSQGAERMGSGQSD